MDEAITWIPSSDKSNVTLTNNNRIEPMIVDQYETIGYHYVTKWHSIGYTSSADEWHLWVNYGPIDVTASSWIVPGTIEPLEDDNG